MFFEKGRWTLEGSDKKLRAQISANGRTVVVNAVFDTGADSCVFPANVRQALFPTSSEGKVFHVHGVGGPMPVIAHYVQIDVLSDDNTKALIHIENVRCLFAVDERSTFSLLGVNGFMDQFCWKLDYPNGFMTASKA